MENNGYNDLEDSKETITSEPTNQLSSEPTSELSNEPTNEVSRMPKDFWYLVQQERARAKAQIERRRQQLYQPFQKEDIVNSSIPMPENFWEAVKSEISLTVSLPPNPFKDNKKTQQAQNVTEIQNSALWNQEIKNSQDSFNSEQTSKALEEQNKQTIEESSAKTLEQPLEEIIEEELSEESSEENEIIYLDSALTFKEAALTILIREKRPMTAKEIASIAINEGLVSTTGKTPDASVAGQLSTDIKRNPNSPFASVGSRTYTLKIFCEYEKKGIALSEVQLSKAHFETSEEKTPGTVISGNFPWQEEKQATNTPLSDSKIENQDDKNDKNDKNDKDDKDDKNDKNDKDDKTIPEILVNEPNQNTIEQEASTKILMQGASSETQEVFQRSFENRKMTFKQAALYLLERMQRPMTANEIANIIVEESLVDSNSKTPAASIAGQLYTDLEKLGEKSIFRQVAPRTFGLAEWYKKNEK
ncbi:MAG: winged helix-turn-helix domain-containing protein [Acidobacteria bacterium]|nr:winged helix-turn-helix domain-containing protein [Acidobacteriota bacterium]